MSKIAYESKDEAKSLVVGNATCSGLGFDHFHWFEGGEEARKFPFDAIHDTEAFVAANDDIIAVVFRGTKTIDNWYTNLMVSTRKCPSEWGVPSPGGEVHQGFDDGVNTVWMGGGGMGETIKTLCTERGKGRKLYLAGHSLGGALATNAAARLAFVHDVDIAGVYTIGSPRLFDRAAAEHFDATMNHGTPLKDKCFRCKNNSDIVTTVPGGRYIHVGTQIFLDQYGSISMATMAERLLDGLLWWLRLEFIRGIDDHATSEYVRLFEQVVINHRVPLLEKAASVMMDTMGRVAAQVMPEAMQTSEGFKKMRRRREIIENVKAMAREAARRF